MKFYLWLNAALYFVFAVWCTVKPTGTSTSLGYLELNSSGRSEYLVIYGGLQLGLALMFGWLAMHREFHVVGVLLGLLFYTPLIAYRVVTVFQNWPVGGLTIATAALEFALWFAALLLWWRVR